MNANELAKLLEVDSWRQQAEQIENLKQWERRHLDVIEKQQAEIETLKKDNKELHAIAQRMAMAESDARKSLQWFKDAKERQSEPVAWAVWEGRPHDLFFTKEEADELCRLKGGDAKTVPLYTHSVKELTDEEIRHIQAICHLKNVGYNTFIMRFARAILRKVQEK
jgi:hypothetical protein